MNIQCVHCEHKITIPDEKVPKGKAFSIKCPKCQKKITYDLKQEEAAPPPMHALTPDPPADADGGDDLRNLPEEEAAGASNPFQFLGEGDKTAAICETDPTILGPLKNAAEANRYHIMAFSTPRETLKQMRFHDFDLVILNELFGTRDPEMNHVLKYLAQLNMTSRRKMFVILVSTTLETGDSMKAFNQSVDFIVNLRDINKLAQIIARALQEHRLFYKVYVDAMAKIKGI